MKISDMTVEGLTPLDVERIRSALSAEAEVHYRRLTQTAILIEKFKPQIVALRRSGFPWHVIAEKLQAATGKSISASSMRNYMERHQRPLRRKSSTSNKNSDDQPNVRKPKADVLDAVDEREAENE